MEKRKNMEKRKKVLTREEAYDSKISPLVAEIIAICKEHKIQFLANFEIGDEDDPGLQCTTNVFGDDWQPSEAMKMAYANLRPRSSSPLMVTTRNGAGQITNITAIM